jgi:hypothetical protein
MVLRALMPTPFQVIFDLYPLLVSLSGAGFALSGPNSVTCVRHKPHLPTFISFHLYAVYGATVRSVLLTGVVIIAHAANDEQY